jgi:iron complex transport system permease protein
VTLSRVLRVSALLFLFFAAISLVSLGVGAIAIAPQDVLSALLGVLAGQEPSAPDDLILFSVRLPRILFAGVVGASLSAGGVIFQALLRNPLADPFVLGISGGSALGAILAIVIGASAFYLGLPFLAFIGALATVFLVFVVAGGPRGVLLDNSLLLAGVVVNSFFSAAILFALSVVDSLELHSISFWLMGDLSRASLPEIGGAALCLVACFAVLYAQARKLNLIVQGEETALQLGVNVRATKYLLLAATSLVIAVAVSFAGIIGFIGIMVPHMMRLVYGSDHRLLLPAAALFGASFLVAADTAARTVLAPSELPVGVITALCGAPYFIFLMRRKERR